MLEKFGMYECGGGELFCRVFEDMLEDLYEIDIVSILDEFRIFNFIVCKFWFGFKVDIVVVFFFLVGS